MLNLIEGRDSEWLPPSRPPVVADRVRVIFVDVLLSVGEASSLSSAPPGVVVVMVGGTTADSVERLPIAMVLVVAVVGGAVLSWFRFPNGGGSEPRGWAKAGTREKRLREAEAEEVPVDSGSGCCGWVGFETVSGGLVAEVDNEVCGAAWALEDWFGLEPDAGVFPWVELL